MPDFFHRRISPLEIVKELPGFVEYNKGVNKTYEYRIIRCSKHDGTLCFSMELIANVLFPILNMQSYYKKSAPYDLSTVGSISYIIGDLHQMVVFGMVDLPCGKYPGQREEIFLPVVCKYKMKNAPAENHGAEPVHLTTAAAQNTVGH
jgi:hypothetical protein